jgi:hypothetical protein
VIFMSGQLAAAGDALATCKRQVAAQEAGVSHEVNIALEASIAIE